MTHTGRAVVFDSVEDMTDRMDHPDLDVTRTTCWCCAMRAEGRARHARGRLSAIPKKARICRRQGHGALSDARMSGTAFGTIVLHIAPEAAAGGPLALVHDGDTIHLDVPSRRLELMVDDAELARRAALLAAPPAHEGSDRGYARLFQEHVLQADEGCDFDFLVPVKAHKSSS